MGIKKLILLLLTLALCTLALFSCVIKGDGTEGGGDGNPSPGTGDEEKPSGGDDGDTDVEEEFIWSDGSELFVIGEEGLDWGAIEFLNDIYPITGKLPTLVTDKGDVNEHEFLFGRSERSLSRSAYMKLERFIEDENAENAWLIYSDGKSVAVAFNTSLAMAQALEYIDSTFLAQKTLALGKGAVIRDAFSYQKYASDVREAEREKLFSELEAQLGRDITNEIRKLMAFYSDDIYEWLVNLYDPTSGGFYYSNSGRDNTGYLPDIESTAQALSHLNSGGMFAQRGGSFAKGLPEEIKAQILGFAQGLQSAQDGYFYHPQWGENIIAARRGRDLGWAISIIADLGAKPLYDTPNGIKGTLGAPSGIERTSLTGRLGESSVSAVSKVVPTASSNLPLYLQSLDAWATYIDSLNISKDSYTAGNTLAAQHHEIKAAGQEYVDYLINYLNNTQIPELGVWEAIPEGKDTDCDPNDGLNYANVNGLMKLASVYNYYSVPVPNLENALRSTIKVALYPNDEGDAHVCCTYNPWVIMSIILSGAEKSEGIARRDELRAIIRENAVGLISATVDKLTPHVREDGCFSYFEKTLSHASQKALVACASTVESDVNATCICSTGIISNMCSALGIDRIPLYYDADYYYFISLFENLGEIVKNPPVPVETITFDDGHNSSVEFGVLNEPADAMEIKVNDKTIDGVKYKYFAADLVDDPFPKGKEDKALKVNNFVYDVDGTRDYAATAMSVYTAITNNYVVGNTYSYESDYLVTKASGGCFMQLFFTRSVEDPSHSLGLNFNAYSAGGKQYIMIGDGYDGPDGERDSNIVSEIPLGEWFKLRVDVYKIYHEIEDGATGKVLDIVAKIYLNGEYVGKSEASVTSSKDPTVVAEKGIGAIIHSIYRFNDSEIYMDNIHAEKLDTVYEETVVPPEPAPDFVATPEGDRTGGEYYNKLLSGEIDGKLYNYNNGEKKPSLSNSIEGKTYIVGRGEGEEGIDPYLFFWRLNKNNVHEAVTYKFKANAKPENAKSLVSIVELDVAFGNIDKSYATMFMIYAGGYRTSVYMSASALGLGFEFTAEASRLTPITQGEWINLMFETYLVNPDEAPSNANVRTKVYINGEFKADLAGVDVAATTSEQVAIQLQYPDPDSWLCLDNLYLGYIDKEFVASEEPVPEGLPEISEGNYGKGEYYLSDKEGGRYGYGAGEAKPAALNAGLHSKVYLSNDVKRAVYFYKSLEEGAANGQATVQYVLPKNVPADYEAIVFETDIAFSGFSNFSSTTKAAGLQLNFVKDKWLAGFFIGFVAADNGIRLQSTKVLRGENILLEENKWYNIRFVVYMGDSDSKSVACIYVNGEYVGDMTPGDDKTSGNSSNTANIVLRQFETDDWVVFDNLYLGYTNEKYVAPDDGEDDDEGGEGGGTVTPEPEDPTPEDPTPDTPKVTLPEGIGGSENRGKGEFYNSTAQGTRSDGTNVSKFSTDMLGDDAEFVTTDTGEMLFKKNVTDTQSNSYVRIYFPAKLEGAVASVVEFDAVLGSSFNDKSAGLVLMVEALGIKGDIFIKGNGESYSSAHPSKVKDGENISVALDEWHNVRLVSYSLDGVLRIMVYIDGEYQMEIETANNTASSSNNRFTFYMQHYDTDGDDWMAIDNVYLGYLTELPEK